MNAHKLSAIIKEGKIETCVDDKSAVFDNKLMKSRETFQLQNWCEQCDLAYSNHQMYKQHMDHFHKRSISNCRIGASSATLPTPTIRCINNIWTISTRGASPIAELVRAVRPCLLQPSDV